MFSKEYWQSSAEKLKSVRYLSIMGMMIALKICLSVVYFPVGENLHISITFIIVAIESSILGPVSGMVSGAITDIVSFMKAHELSTVRLQLQLHKIIWPEKDKGV